MIKKTILALSALLSYATGDVAHLVVHQEIITTPSPPPRPYAFGYAAGRFPGHIDRTHSEVSDGSGVVQGSYSYVDPRQKIRTVEYLADKDGFHVLNDQGASIPSDSAAVAHAKQKHIAQFKAIAASRQAHPGQVVVPLESAAVAAATQRHLAQYNSIAHAHASQPGLVVVPGNTVAVQRATDKHLTLFQKIAAEHASIAAEREAIRLAYEATAKPNELY